LALVAHLVRHQVLPLLTRIGQHNPRLPDLAEMARHQHLEVFQQAVVVAAAAVQELALTLLILD
jgi:hypothetical protein